MFTALKIARTHPAIAAIALGSAAASTYFAIVGYTLLQAGIAEPLRSPQTEMRPASATNTVPRATATEVARAVLRRNIFDSSAGEMAWEGAQSDPVELEADAGGGEELAPVPDALPRCTGDMQLLAALIFDRDPQRTYAVLRRGSVSKVVPLQADLEGTQLLALYPTHAYVKEPSGATCQLPLYKAAGGTPAAPPPPTPRKEEPKKSNKKLSLFTAEELDAGIVSLGGDRYKVSRELLTRAMADAASVIRGTKFLPQTGGQRDAGVKIQGVREGSTLHKLGMRDGDILRALNGVDLSSPDGMLGAYGLLREQNSLTLAITRGGNARNLQYTLD